MQTTTLYLPDELQRQLQEVARRLGRSQAELIRGAERNGGQVLTLDRRDVGVVAREGTITVRPG
jgi:predicted transcriptional regulator